MRRLPVVALITVAAVALSACGSLEKPRQAPVTSAPGELRKAPLPNNNGVTVTPRPLPTPFELEPTERKVVTQWGNITDFRAVSSMEQPRLVVECYRGERLVVRHDDLNTAERLTSRSVFRIGDRTTVAIGDQYNNIPINRDTIDNLVERMYRAPASTQITVTTDDETTTVLSLNGFRTAAAKVFAVCGY